MFILISEFSQAKETISPYEINIFYRYTHAKGEIITAFRVVQITI
jgi:hypothetical protein